MRWVLFVILEHTRVDMPEAVFRIAFYAFPLIGVYVALRAAPGAGRLSHTPGWRRDEASKAEGFAQLHVRRQGV